MNSENPVKSYISPKVVVRPSPIHGLGMFAEENIAKGEIVFIKGGHIVTREELFSSEQINSYLPLSDDFFIGAKSPEEEIGIKLFINHSCDPNCGMQGEITFVALKEIFKGEELTCDYAMIDNESYEFECNCGTVCCRKVVTGYDWKLEELQVKYKGLFARYLMDKISHGFS